MADPSDDLAGRVTALEEQMRQVREDAAAARVLAGSADRDVAEFHTKLAAHNQTLNALRTTQLEQGERLAALERTVDDGFAEMREGFGTLSAGMERIVELLRGESRS